MNAMAQSSIAPLGVAQAAPETELTESTILQIADVAADFEEVRTDLFEMLRGTTACSSTVFYGLLAWANLHAHNPSKSRDHHRHGTVRHRPSFVKAPRATAEQHTPGGAAPGSRGTSNMRLKGEL